jgi:hypothetical protein
MRKNFRDLINGESPRLVIWIYPIISLLVLIGLPWLLTRHTIFDSFAFDDTGQIGDTIGGIAGPVIALIVGLLTFLAFWVQFQSNRAQTAQFKKQDTDTKIDRFENRFYELLQLHRDNISEMSVGKYRKGRRVFLSMYDELKFCYYVVKLVNGSQQELKVTSKDLNEEDMMNIAFTLFFMGVGDSSIKMSENILKHYDATFIKLCNESLIECQRRYKKKEKLSVFYQRNAEGREQNFDLRLSYAPFQGHMSRLGHYYRHLFQAVKYVVEQPDDLKIDKYEYLKTLRAQLSSHEQLLLYYNSFTKMGGAWVKNNLFTDYRFIKNIPLPLADIGMTPKERLGTKNQHGQLIFEWDEYE